MELNREQIIRALECCYTDKRTCSDCPFQDPDKYMECSGLALSALELIKELSTKTEAQDMVISELRRGIEKANHDADRYAAKIKELTEENEAWQEQLKKSGKAYEHGDALLKNIGKHIYQVYGGNISEGVIESVEIGEKDFKYGVFVYNEYDVTYIKEEDIGRTYFWTIEAAREKATENKEKRENSPSLRFYDVELLENAKVMVPPMLPEKMIEEGKKVEFRAFTNLRKERDKEEM